MQGGPLLESRSTKYGVCLVAIQRLSNCLLTVFALAALAACGGKHNGPLSRTELRQSPQAALAGLPSLAAPNGVDSALWAELTRELARVLEERVAGRLAAIAPTGTKNAVSDLVLAESSAELRLEWTYINIGDYDLNGVANISDLTAIGKSFGKTSASPDWEQAQLADGDGNGEVNVADITPLGQGFGSEVASYRISGAHSPDGPWTQAGTLPFSAADRSGVRPRFSYALSAVDYSYYSVEPLDSAGAQGTAAPALPSSLSLDRLEQSSGQPGTVVQLSGTGFTADSSALGIEFDGTRFPLLAVGGGNASFMVPPLPAGSYELRLVTPLRSSNALSFTVEAVTGLPLTQAEFAARLETDSVALADAVGGMIAQAELDNLGVSVELAADAQSTLDLLGGLASEIKTEVNALSPEAAARLQALLANSGVLDTLSGLSSLKQSSAAKIISASDGYGQHRFLLSCDTLSMVLTNVGFVLDRLNEAALLAEVVTLGAATPVVGASLAIEQFIAVMDWALDTVVPTDLKALHERGHDVDAFIFPDLDGDGEVEHDTLETIAAGQTFPYNVKGSFTNEKKFVGGTFDSLLDGLLSIGLTDPATLKTGKEQAKQYVKNLVAQAGVSGLSELLQSADSLDRYLVEPPLEVDLDMRLYNLAQGNLLLTLFPDAPQLPAALDRLLRSLGTNPALAGSVRIDNPTALAYDYETGQLTTKQTGDASIRLHGMRWEDSSKLLGLVTLCLPVEVKSELGQVVKVSGEWIIVNVDPGAEGFSGAAVSLAVIDGSPAIGYIPGNQDYLYYAVSGLKDGSQASSWTRSLVSSLGDMSGVLEDISLQEVNGKPGIAFCHWANNPGLMFARARTNGKTTSDWKSILIDSGDPSNNSVIGTSPSLAIIDGYPAISYYDEELFSLKYVRSFTIDGDELGAWKHPLVLHSDIEIDSTALINSLHGPVISYICYSGYNEGWRYIRSDTASGGSAHDWSAPITLSDSAGLCTGITLIEDKPAVAYSQGNTIKIYLSKTTNGRELADWNLLTQFSGSHWHSLKAVQDKLAICYTIYDEPNQTNRLLFASPTNGSGSSTADWNQIVRIDDDIYHQALSMTEIDNKPAIAYFDRIYGLRFAIRK